MLPEYFIAVISFLLVLSIGLVIKLMYDLSNLKYELKLGKINCQKDLDRLESRLNDMTRRDSTSLERELEKLEKIQQNLLNIVDTRISDIESIRHNKRIIND